MKPALAFSIAIVHTLVALWTTVGVAIDAYQHDGLATVRDSAVSLAIPAALAALSWLAIVAGRHGVTRELAVLLWIVPVLGLGLLALGVICIAFGLAV